MHVLLNHKLLGHVGGGKWPGDEAKTMPCTFMMLSVLTVALYTCLWYNLDTELEWTADCDTALITAWMGADSALKDAV